MGDISSSMEGEVVWLVKAGGESAPKNTTLDRVVEVSCFGCSDQYLCCIPTSIYLTLCTIFSPLFLSLCPYPLSSCYPLNSKLTSVLFGPCPS